MIFLRSIEGLTGEDLTSAVLKWLLVRSSRMREWLATELKAGLPASRAPSFASGIICDTEAPTECGDDNSGFIDLLVEDPGRLVIGIENKLWASFTDDQPRKYLKGLEARAKGRAGDATAFLMVMLIPEAREQEVNAHLEAQQMSDKTRILKWERIREILKQIRDQEGRETANVARMLEEYLDWQIRSVSIDIDPSHVVGNQVEIGNTFHWEYLYRLKSVFPRPGRIRQGSWWIGFHFPVQREDDGSETPVRAWCGFARREGRTLFGIHHGRAEYQPSAPFEAGPKLWGGVTFVVVPIDDSLNSVSAWKEKTVSLRPVVPRMH